MLSVALQLVDRLLDVVHGPVSVEVLGLCSASVLLELLLKVGEPSDRQLLDGRDVDDPLLQVQTQISKTLSQKSGEGK